MDSKALKQMLSYHGSGPTTVVIRQMECLGARLDIRWVFIAVECSGIFDVDWLTLHFGFACLSRSLNNALTQDDWDCFAPSVGTMLKNFNYDYVKAAKAYCGREAEIT